MNCGRGTASTPGMQIGGSNLTGTNYLHADVTAGTTYCYTHPRSGRRWRTERLVAVRFCDCKRAFAGLTECLSAIRLPIGIVTTALEEDSRSLRRCPPHSPRERSGPDLDGGDGR